MITAYQCDPNGVFIGTTSVQKDPQEPGVLLLPPFCTEVPPPNYDAATQLVVFKDGAWAIEAIPVIAPPAEPVVEEFATAANKPQAGANELAVVSEGKWRLVPDFRGIPYWVNGVLGYPITELGVSPPEGFSLVAPPPTKAEVIAGYTRAIQKYLDDFAKTRNYDDILSACTYATSTVPKFAAEGKVAVDLRDATWAAAYDLLDKVQAGTIAAPTEAELLTMLPALAWPAEHNI